MKKLFIALTLAFCFSARAALDTYTLTAHESVMPCMMATNDLVLTTTTSTPIDLTDFIGYATIGVFHGASATNAQSIVSVQQTNTTSGGWSVLRAVTNTADAASLTRIPLEIGSGGRWLRCVYTSTNGISGAAVFINGFKNE